MIDNEKSEETQSDEEILRIARERFKLASEAETEIRKLALEDLEFSSGDQWPGNIKLERSKDNRPCLVINRIPQFIRQITNDQRQNRPAIKVSAVDDKADIDTARILQGLIRHIEYNSNADIAYDTAFDGAVRKGFGYFRIVTDYVDPMSFEQEILIKRIRNSFSVYLDPNSKEPDGSDMNWGFVFEDISREEYEETYEDSALSQMDDWTSIGDMHRDWVDKSSVRVAEYFYKDYKSVQIVQLSDGHVMEKSQLPHLPEGISIVAERTSLVPVIKWCKINGTEILQKTDWPGKWIPIVPVFGDELDINGKRILEGVVRHAKDSQRMYNYWASTETETIALAPRAPFIVAEGQVSKEYENIWKSANSKPHAYLPYKPTSLNGQPISPPQRNVYEAPVQAITNARMQASDDMKSTTGIYDSALGNRSNESSGIAIQRRNVQSQTSNFHFIDNLSRSQRHAGRIIVDLIPKIYDTPRTARIIGEEGNEEIVKINQVFEHKGESKIYDLSAGKYDVTIDNGPSFATKRQEALASMLDLTKAYPQVAQIAGDLMVKNMDWPGASEIAERLKKTLPPGVADSEDKNPQQKQIPPEVQNQMQQMGQLIDQLTQKLNESTEVIKTKSLELESRERIEFAKMEVDMKKELLKANAPMSMAILNKEIEHINQRLGLLNFDQTIDSEMNESGFQSGAAPQQQMQEPQQPTGGPSPG